MWDTATGVFLQRVRVNPIARMISFPTSRLFLETYSDLLGPTLFSSGAATSQQALSHSIFVKGSMGSFGDGGSAFASSRVSAN